MDCQYCEIQGCLGYQKGFEREKACVMCTARYLITVEKIKKFDIDCHGRLKGKAEIDFRRYATDLPQLRNVYGWAAMICLLQKIDPWGLEKLEVVDDNGRLIGKAIEKKITPGMSQWFVHMQNGTKYLQGLDLVDVQNSLFACHLEEGPRVPYVGSKLPDGALPIHTAALSGDLEIIQRSLDAGINVNIKNIHNETPLDYAIANKQLDAVKYLIARGGQTAGIDQHIKNLINDGDDDLPFIDYLFELGGDIDLAVMAATSRCLFSSQRKANTLEVAELVKYFHQRGANLGKITVYDAARDGNLPLVRYLVEMCYRNVNEKDSNGNTALDLAYYFNSDHPKLIRYLEKNGGTHSSFVGSGPYNYMCAEINSQRYPEYYEHYAVFKNYF